MSVKEPLLNHKELRNHDPCMVLVLLTHTLSLQNDFLNLSCTSWSVSISFYCLLISLITTSSYLVLLNRETHVVYCICKFLKGKKIQENMWYVFYLYFVQYVLTGTIERHWEYICNHNKDKMKILGDKNVDSKCEDSENKFDFSVMSYNILSQNLLEDNSHLYRHCRRPVLHWSFRFPNILKEIKHFDADVSTRYQNSSHKKKLG